MLERGNARRSSLNENTDEKGPCFQFYPAGGSSHALFYPVGVRMLSFLPGGDQRSLNSKFALQGVSSCKTGFILFVSNLCFYILARK